MNNRYRLGGLGDDELLAALPVLVQRGNENTADLLAQLAELDERRLYLDLGVSVAVRVLPRSARLVRVRGGSTDDGGACVPTVSGSVCAGSSRRAAPFSLVRDEPSFEPGERCGAHRRVQSQNSAAGRRGTGKTVSRPDVKGQIRRLPGGSSLDPLSEDRYGVHFTADGEFRALLDKARALTRHHIPAGDLAGLMKLGLKALIRESEKRRFAVGRRPKAHPPGGRDSLRDAPKGDANANANANANASGTEQGKTGGGRSRHVPAAVARSVYLRDDGQCTFIAQDGRRCGARDFIEIDHIDPFAVGGVTDTGNLRLRCRAHNQQHARRYFGTSYIQAAIARARGEQQTGSSPAGDQNRAHAGAFGG